MTDSLISSSDAEDPFVEDCFGFSVLVAVVAPLATVAPAGRGPTFQLVTPSTVSRLR